jgi:TRAP-type mannitol/chloroaromatic compound transport system permease small subunit
VGVIAAIGRALDRVTDTVGRVVMWLAVLVVLVQLAVVLLRYGFSTSFIQLQKSVIYNSRDPVHAGHRLHHAA